MFEMKIVNARYSSQVNYLEDLNERQKEAVLTTEGPVSVLAGAGSGKTKVLTTRIYHLIRSGVAPEKILAVTFTNKAAREMRERLSKRLGEELSVWKRGSLPLVATFHGLGRELLEQYGSVMGIARHFSIFDREDSERAIKQALKVLEIDPKEIPPRAILSRMSKAKSDGMNVVAFAEKYGKESFRSRTTARVWELYNQSLKSEKALDFDDLISLPVELLREHDEVRTQVQDQFHYIHIDEYQDTNRLQGELATLLCGERKNLFVVGDIDQTIYTWRGATIDNLLEFESLYPQAKTIVLEHNYRSSRNIVDTANQIIEKNTNRKNKHSVTKNPAGDLVRVFASGTAEQEAEFVALESQRLIASGIRPDEIAVLYRTNFQSRALEEAMLRAGVSYRLLGTQFYDRKEVKDVLSWVRLALDPSREADRVRAVQAPTRGIGKVTLGKIAAGKQGEFKPSERAKVDTFERTVARLHEASLTFTPSRFVQLVIEESGIKGNYEKGGDDDLERLENAKELATLASRHDETPGRAGIAAFLADAALAGDQDELDRPKMGRAKSATESAGVTLMTVHAAKGLEFSAVFVTGLEEGLFPHAGLESEDRDEEEERRLFYVAVTRAKEKLYLTLARVRRIFGTDYLQEPSTFLHDIDQSLIVYVGIEDERESVIDA